MAQIVVLDACVLYPAPLRDFLLHVAHIGLYVPKWSAIIQDEWLRNLLANRLDLTVENLQKTTQAMQNAFPDAEVTDFEALIPTINLPDKDDRHVLATAIKAEATCILTFNLKDFPQAELDKWHITALNPDDFMVRLWQENAQEIRKAFENQVKMLKNPPMTFEQVLANLAVCGLYKTVECLRCTSRVQVKLTSLGLCKKSNSVKYYFELEVFFSLHSP